MWHGYRKENHDPAIPVGYPQGYSLYFDLLVHRCMCMENSFFDSSFQRGMPSHLSSFLLTSLCDSSIIFSTTEEIANIKYFWNSSERLLQISNQYILLYFSLFYFLYILSVYIYSLCIDGHFRASVFVAWNLFSAGLLSRGMTIAQPHNRKGTWLICTWQFETTLLLTRLIGENRQRKQITCRTVLLGRLRWCDCCYNGCVTSPHSLFCFLPLTSFYCAGAILLVVGVWRLPTLVFFVKFYLKSNRWEEQYRWRHVRSPLPLPLPLFESPSLLFRFPSAFFILLFSR